MNDVLALLVERPAIGHMLQLWAPASWSLLFPERVMDHRVERMKTQLVSVLSWILNKSEWVVEHGIRTP